MFGNFKVSFLVVLNLARCTDNFSGREAWCEMPSFKLNKFEKILKCESTRSSCQSTAAKCAFRHINVHQKDNSSLLPLRGRTRLCWWTSSLGSRARSESAPRTLWQKTSCRQVGSTRAASHFHSRTALSLPLSNSRLFSPCLLFLLPLLSFLSSSYDLSTPSPFYCLLHKNPEKCYKFAPTKPRVKEKMTSEVK